MPALIQGRPQCSPQSWTAYAAAGKEHKKVSKIFSRFHKASQTQKFGYLDLVWFLPDCTNLQSYLVLTQGCLGFICIRFRYWIYLFTIAPGLGWANSQVDPKLDPLIKWTQDWFQSWNFPWANQSGWARPCPTSFYKQGPLHWHLLQSTSLPTLTTVIRVPGS